MEEHVQLEKGNIIASESFYWMIMKKETVLMIIILALPVNNYIK